MVFAVSHAATGGQQLLLRGRPRSQGRARFTMAIMTLLDVVTVLFVLSGGQDLDACAHLKILYVCDYIAVSLVRTLTSPASWDARYAVASAKASAVPATTTR